MSMTMEQAVTQLQQELFTLRGQVAAESVLAEAVRAINNLATAQVRKDTPSLIDVKCLGRPKDSSGRGRISTVVEEDGGIFLGVIKLSEMMLEWAAEQTTEITMWTDECETWSVCVAADAYRAHAFHERRGE